jgi:hypothetical protein
MGRDCKCFSYGSPFMAAAAPTIDLPPPTNYVQRQGAMTAPHRAISAKGAVMVTFDDRQKGEEAKFAHDATLRFKAEARRNKLLGIWVAEMLGLDAEGAKTYAAEVVAADFQEAGDEDVFRKISADLEAKGVSVGEDVIRKKMIQLSATAREQVLAEG